MIEVSPSDFIRMNGGLVRLLRDIQKAGPSGIPTRRLCEQVFNSRTYGMKMIYKAKRDGYIKRVIQPKPSGQKGNHLTVNYLTPKGLQLLDKLSVDTQQLG